MNMQRPEGTWVYYDSLYFCLFVVSLRSGVPGEVTEEAGVQSDAGVLYADGAREDKYKSPYISFSRCCSNKCRQAHKKGSTFLSQVKSFIWLT